MENIFIDKKGRLYKKECRFSIGDIVRIDDAGFLYEYYEEAFYKMHGNVLNPINLRRNEDSIVHSEISLVINDEKIKKKLKKLNFVVFNKSRHSFSSIMYLLYNPRFRIALIIGEGGLKLVKSGAFSVNEKNINFHAFS